MKKIFTLLIALILMVSTLAGCNKGEEVNTGEISDVAVNELADTVEDSSDLPDWTGKKLELTMWYATGSYALNKNNISTNDVVTPEIYRVTGVKFSDDSYDNNGETQDAKMAKVIATNSWPDVIKGGQNTEELSSKGLLWELSELIPKYMPHLHKLMERGFMSSQIMEDGKIYEIDVNPSVTYAYPEMDPEILARTEVPVSNTGCVLVRDDILKQLKPEAYTQDELIEIFNKNGKFTEEEILNAAFNSKEEFYQFLRDVKALGVKVGNREVYPTYAFGASDNWDFLTVLAGGLNGWNTYPNGPGNNYFTYFDVGTGKIESMLEQDFFRETMRELTELVREDVISQDSLIDSRATYEEKCASGQYAVLYGGTAPDPNKLNETSQGYKYRKVILNIPYNTEKFLPAKNQLQGGYKFAFLKDRIAEEDLPQILRYFDFLLTDVGQKLTQWGPRSAGLFEETENGRRFTNKEVEDQAVYGVANDAQLKYGLNAQQWPGYPSVPNKWKPIYIYDYVPNLSRMNYFYSTGMFDPMEIIHSIGCSIYDFTNQSENAKIFWGARTAFETAMTRVLAATSEEEFENLYQTLLNTSRSNGLNQELLDEINEIWSTQNNKDYMQNVEDYLKKVK